MGRGGRKGAVQKETLEECAVEKLIFPLSTGQNSKGKI